jgi:hypothetical protein
MRRLVGRGHERFWNDFIVARMERAQFRTQFFPQRERYFLPSARPDFAMGASSGYLFSELHKALQELTRHARPLTGHPRLSS